MAVAQDDEVGEGAAGVEVVVDEGADVPLAGGGEFALGRGAAASVGDDEETG